MILGLKEHFFIASAIKAKQLVKNNLRIHKKTTHYSSKSKNHPSKSLYYSAGLEKLSLKNQRRIMRLRKKKQSSKEIIGLLHQEMINHKISQEQLLASIEFLKHKETIIKKKSFLIIKKQKILSELKLKLQELNNVISSESKSDETIKLLYLHIKKLSSLINKKESELESLLKD